MHQTAKLKPSADEATRIKAQACADAGKDFEAAKANGNQKSFLAFLVDRLENEIDQLVRGGQ